MTRPIHHRRENRVYRLLLKIHHFYWSEFLPNVVELGLVDNRHDKGCVFIGVKRLQLPRRLRKLFCILLRDGLCALSIVGICIELDDRGLDTQSSDLSVVALSHFSPLLVVGRPKRPADFDQ